MKRAKCSHQQQQVWTAHLPCEAPSFHVSPSQAAINAFYLKCDGNNTSPPLL